jgi:two-component system response regulator LytT
LGSHHTNTFIIMNILIVEDITLIAERIADLVKTHLENTQITISHTLDDAKIHIQEKGFDLLFLDLNLNGKDGFELLETAAASSFQTIVITANREQAATAFDYGVFDFISKPILENRFKLAMDRLQNGTATYREQLKQLAVKKRGAIQLIPIENVVYIKASGNYSEIYTNDGQCLLHDKNLEKLLQLVPEQFCRVHRSYVVDTNQIQKIIKHGSGKYSLQLKHNINTPLSREYYKKMDI